MLIPARWALVGGLSLAVLAPANILARIGEVYPSSSPHPVVVHRHDATGRHGDRHVRHDTHANDTSATPDAASTHDTASTHDATEPLAPLSDHLGGGHHVEDHTAHDD